MVPIAAIKTGAVDSIAASHAKANVPSADQFDRLVTRDLKANLAHQIERDLDVEYELLRQGPTQTDISYPKYYLWVKGIDGTQVVLEGAARIAAVEQTRFEVTHFLSRQEIKASKANVENIFPVALVPLIVNKARADDGPR